MSVTCVPIYGLMFRILTRFHTLYFGLSCIHRNSIVWRHVILACFPYWPEKQTRRISRYSNLLETLISSEYGLTISGHVTVLCQGPLEKNTDYISKYVNCLSLASLNFKLNRSIQMVPNHFRTIYTWTYYTSHKTAPKVSWGPIHLQQALPHVIISKFITKNKHE